MNYIPNKLITVDDKDPPWMNESIKKIIMPKKYACKSFNANKKNYDAYLKLQTISTELSEMILKRKEDYYCVLSHKLNDPHTKAKSYWSILKTLYNGKKIQLIPPISHLFMDGVQLPQGDSHFEEAIYFLPFSSQKFLVLILSTSEG